MLLVVPLWSDVRRRPSRRCPGELDRLQCLKWQLMDSISWSVLLHQGGNMLRIANGEVAVCAVGRSLAEPAVNCGGRAASKD